MEDNRTTTFVFSADKIDEYKRGFISGIMYFLSGKPSDTSRWHFASDTGDGDIWIKQLDCTVDQGLEIQKEIERHIPGAIIEMS